MIFRRCLCVFALLLLPALGHAVEVHASLDRSTASLGDTVTLNLRVEGASGQVDLPDLNALNQDFDVLGTSQSRSLSITNGVRNAQFTIGVALRPKHTGSLQIPALTVDGTQTIALTLQVTAADSNVAASGQQDVFMEAQIQPLQAYVGQQLSYDVKLYYAVDLSGSLGTPQLAGAQVTQVGDDLKYSTQRGGRQYNVVERRYAVVPQHAGHLAISPLRFDGSTSDPSDPNSFFGASTPVSASAPALTVEVQAAPPLASGTAWLPARQLSLTLDGLPSAATSLRVGQPINVTMTLQATGLPAAALPALSLATLDGATVYPDKTVSSTHANGPWWVGQRQQKFAIIPDRAGTLTLPATTLTWWNVLTNKSEVAQVPAQTLTILPAIGGSTTAPNVPGVAASGTGAGARAARVDIQSTAHGSVWRWIALGSVGLWLLSVLAWWWRRRSKTAIAPSEKPLSSRQYKEAFLRAAAGSDAAVQVRTLLAWARCERPGLQNLGDLAAALADARQIAAVAALQRRHYAGADAANGVSSLASVFQRGFVWRDANTSNTDSYLPPLYPFDLKTN